MIGVFSTTTHFDPPAVIAVDFDFTIPAIAGDVLGTVSATNNPDTMIIARGNDKGYFVISYFGVLTVTSTGTAELVDGVYPLLVRATNNHGSGFGLVTVTVRSQRTPK